MQKIKYKTSISLLIVLASILLVLLCLVYTGFVRWRIRLKAGD